MLGQLEGLLAEKANRPPGSAPKPSPVPLAGSHKAQEEKMRSRVHDKDRCESHFPFSALREVVFLDAAENCLCVPNVPLSPWTIHVFQTELKKR